MEYLKSFELFENETSMPQNLKELKKLMRKESNLRGDFFGDFSLNIKSHRGNFMFYESPDIWDSKGEMRYTGSGNPELYIDKANKKFFNPLGWEMIDMGNRTIKVQKL